MFAIIISFYSHLYFTR